MGGDAEEKGKSAGYNASYYQRNKEKIAAKRRQRYREDPEYRKLIKEATKRSKAKKRAARKAKKAGGRPSRRGPSKPRTFRIDVNGTDVETEMFTAGRLAQVLDRGIQTIRQWEKKGILPEAMYRTERGVRLYTGLQLRLLAGALKAARKDPNGAKLVKTRISKSTFPERAKQIWIDYPLGIDLNEE